MNRPARGFATRAALILTLAALAATPAATAAGQVLAAEDRENAQIAVLEETGTEPRTSSPAAVVMDAKTGLIVYEKQKDWVYYPASVTKIMTALLTLEYAKKDGQDRLDERVTFSREAVYSLPVGSSNIAMDEGETLTIEEALYALLLASANEVANALAEHIGGTQEAFARAMTERARELGAVNTQFKNAHGLHDDTHFSTAQDMALIMREALKHPEFAQIIATAHYDLPPTERQPETRPLNNSNRMILPASEYYNEYVVGGKTGFTNEAMHTLVTYSKKGEAELIVSIMHGEERGAPYVDTTALLEDIFGQYREITLLDKSEYEKKIPVVTARRGEKETVGTVEAEAEEDVRLWLPESAAARATVTDDAPDELSRSVAQGEKVGTLTVSCGGVALGSVALIAKNSVDAPPEEPGEQAGESGAAFFGLSWGQAAVMAAAVIALILAVLAVLTRMRRRSRRTMRYGLRKKPAAYRYRDH